MDNLLQSLFISESAFENIVRNALRYSHSRIEVAFTEQNQGYHYYC